MRQAPSLLNPPTSPPLLFFFSFSLEHPPAPNLATCAPTNACLIAFWFRSSVVPVLFSLIAEIFLREVFRLYLFLDLAGGPLGLLIALNTVPLELHYLGLTRISFHRFFRLVAGLRRRDTAGEIKVMGILWNNPGRPPVEAY
jgi:hypothetical protein